MILEDSRGCAGRIVELAAAKAADEGVRLR